jgi:amino acid transporter
LFEEFSGRLWQGRLARSKFVSAAYVATETRIGKGTPGFIALVCDSCYRWPNSLPRAQEMASPPQSKPLRALSVVDGAVFLIGVVVGVGIFKTPSLIAANVPNEAAFYGVWLLGGLVMLIGALCYAELGSAHPDAGGEYRFLTLAYGKPVGLLFAWARGTVIQTGAIAAVAFVYGEYASVILPLGRYSTAVHAASAVIALTTLNLIGTPQTVWTQWGLTSLTVATKIILIISGVAAAAPVAEPAVATDFSGSVGLATVFVLLTYGGWNEAAYLGGELKDARRNMVRTLLIGTAAVIVIYLAVNYAYLHALGLQGLRTSPAIASDVMRRSVGDIGATALSVMICVCALSTLSVTIFTGARTYYAVGRDFAFMRQLGVWELHGDNPKNALLLQCSIALALILFGGVSREGFEAMVAYTAPVFWFFLFLVAVSVMIFRKRGGALPYRMPLYPLPPLLLALAALWMIWSSIAYAGAGALIGVCVLLLGTPLLWFSRDR